MSRSSGKKHRRKDSRSRPAQSRISDRSIYGALIIIGLAVVALGFLQTTGKHWQEVLLGYLLIVMALVNMSAFNAYIGRQQAAWQRALARLPLQCVRYGTKHGKPIEAAHNSPRARNMVIISILFSLIVLTGLTLLLFRKQIF